MEKPSDNKPTASQIESLRILESNNLGHLDSNGRFTINHSNAQRVSNEYGISANEIIDNVLIVNKRVPDHSMLRFHINNSGHGNLDYKGNSFFDRLLIFDPRIIDQKKQRNFILVNLISQIKSALKIRIKDNQKLEELLKHTYFIQSITQAILIGYLIDNKNSSPIPTRILKLVENHLAENKIEKSEFFTKLKSEVIEMTKRLVITTWNTAKSSIAYNQKEINKKESINTINPSDLVMEICQKLLVNYLPNLPFIEINKINTPELEKTELHPELMSLIENLFKL